MSFFRAGPALSHLLRHDALHSSLLPRSTVSPLARVMLDGVCQPRCSAPLYTLYHVRSDSDRHASSHQQSGGAQQRDGSSAQHQQQPPQQANTELQDPRRERHLESRRHWKRQRQLQSHHPFSLLHDAFMSPFSSSFPSLLGRSPFGPFARSLPAAAPEMSIDMFSTETSYNIHAAVPGLDKRDIRITVDDGVLRIEAERREERKERKPNTAASSSSSASSASSSSLPVNGSQQSATTQAADSSSGSASATPSTTTSSSSSTPSTTTTADSSSAVKAEGESGEEAVEYSYQESYYGRVERSLALPEDADADKLTARYENGVIKIEIPRAAEQKKEARRIEIQ